MVSEGRCALEAKPLANAELMEATRLGQSHFDHPVDLVRRDQYHRRADNRSCPVNEKQICVKETL